MTPGTVLTAQVVDEHRRVLEEHLGFPVVEVVIARGPNDAVENSRTNESSSKDGFGHLATFVAVEVSHWPGLVRAGLGAASGEHVVVLDVNRHYSPESLALVIAPVQAGRADLAIAVPMRGRSRFNQWARVWPGARLVSRLMLGTADVFSGLFAVRRAIWDPHSKQWPARRSSMVLDLLMRRHPRCIDVPVTVDNHFRPGRIGIKDIRPVKRIIDARFGNYSRLVQFCIVGASGMVVDLTSYALLQYLLSFTWLAERNSAIFNCSWHLALAAAMSIAIALVWNFTLNRRLTFNDAHKGALLRQFFTYVLSNALAIVLSFSVRLYLPAHVGFFARHRLAAAVVGIVAATGISFTMARWLVFARGAELKSTPPFPLHPPGFGQPTEPDEGGSGEQSDHFPLERSAFGQPTSVP